MKIKVKGSYINIFYFKDFSKRFKIGVRFRHGFTLSVCIGFYAWYMQLWIDPKCDRKPLTDSEVVALRLRYKNWLKENPDESVTLYATNE